MSTLRKIEYEVRCAIEEALVALCDISRPNFSLLIARHRGSV